MDAIERVSDSVAALVGRDLTLEECHQFILDVAQMMEPVKPLIVGGSEQQETHVRWRTPDRTLRLWLEGTTVHSSFGDTTLNENDEYYNLESDEPEYKPYRWMIPLGPEINDISIRSRPCVMCSCWDKFDLEFDRSFSDMVSALAMMPPQWRPDIRYRWDLGVADLGVVTARLSADGVEVSSDATGESVLLPPGFPLGFGKVLAGLAGGARLRDVPMLAHGGLPVTPLSPNGKESPAQIEEFDWYEEENEEDCAPDTDDNRRPTLTFAQLRELAAQASDDAPAASVRGELQTSALKTSIGFDQMCYLVDQWARGVPLRQLFEAMGGAADPAASGSALVGDGWRAEEERGGARWELTVSPTPPRARLDPRQGAAAAWQLSSELTRMFGLPRFGDTTSDFSFSRLYRVGDRGVEVRMLGELTITFGAFTQLAPVEFAD